MTNALKPSKPLKQRKDGTLKPSKGGIKLRERWGERTKRGDVAVGGYVVTPKPKPLGERPIRWKPPSVNSPHHPDYRPGIPKGGVLQREQQSAGKGSKSDNGGYKRPMRTGGTQNINVPAERKKKNALSRYLG